MHAHGIYDFPCALSIVQFNKICSTLLWISLQCSMKINVNSAQCNDTTECNDTARSITCIDVNADLDCIDIIYSSAGQTPCEFNNSVKS